MNISESHSYSRCRYNLFKKDIKIIYVDINQYNINKSNKIIKCKKYYNFLIRDCNDGS